MKELLPWILLLAVTVGWYLDHRTAPAAAHATAPFVQEVAPPGEPGQVFALDDLRERLAASGRPYLPFLDAPTLRAGLYALPAGAEDRQQPHDKDEVYYVIQGRSSINIDGEDHAVQSGSVIFVAAHVAHRFYDITEDLQVLVFFSEAGPAPAGH